MALNKKSASKSPAKTHKNQEGGNSYAINDPFTRLRISATSCFFGEPAFYVDGESAPKTSPRLSYGQTPISGVYGEALLPVSTGKNTRQIMEEAIDACLAVDIERTLQFAVELRNDWHFRATPQVIMVRAALHPAIAESGLIAKYAPQIMTRLDEVMNQMAYFESVRGNLKRIPSRLKRAWEGRLSQANEYELAKYKMAGRQVNVFDAVNLTHANSEAIDKLKKNKLSLGNEGLETWESIRSGGGSWKDAAKVMGHMALLRNLRNLHTEGELTDALLEKLKGGVEGGKQMPFRYFSAYKAIGTKSGKVADALEECLEISLRYTMPRFEGRGLTICDVSGSMDTARVSANSEMSAKEIAVLMSAVTNRTFANGGDTLLFATTTEFVEPRRKTSLFTEMENMIQKGRSLGGSTNIVNPFYEIIKHKKFYDVIFVYSDMQCGYDNNVPNLVKEYRKTVNPNVQIFFVNLAGYQDALVPEFYDRTYLLGGWSDKMLQFAERIMDLTKS
jgi:hypothetical protein